MGLQTPKPNPSAASGGLDDYAFILMLGVRYREREFFIDNLLVRNHFIIEVVWWTGLAPWECKFPFPGSLMWLHSTPQVAHIQRVAFPKNPCFFRRTGHLRLERCHICGPCKNNETMSWGDGLVPVVDVRCRCVFSGGHYRDTSSIRNRLPVGPYSRAVPRALWWS